MKWLLQHGFHEKALAVVEEGKARTELLEEVYVSHLMKFLAVVSSIVIVNCG